MREGVFTVVEKAAHYAPENSEDDASGSGPSVYGGSRPDERQRLQGNEKEDKSGLWSQRCSKASVMRWLRRAAGWGRSVGTAADTSGK